MERLWGFVTELYHEVEREPYRDQEHYAALELRVIRTISNYPDEELVNGMFEYALRRTVDMLPEVKRILCLK